MPSLPRPERNRRDRRKQDPRRPTGRQEQYINKNWWKAFSRRYRLSHPLCAACLAEGRTPPQDVTPGEYKGAVDHIIRVDTGGALSDERNLMALGGVGSRCKHHERKTSLEGKGVFDNIQYELNENGEKVPTDKGRTQAINLLIRSSDALASPDQEVE